MSRQNELRFIKSIKRKDTNNDSYEHSCKENIIRKIEGVEKDKIENIITSTASMTLYALVILNYGIDINLATIAPFLPLGAFDLSSINGLYNCKKALSYVKENMNSKDKKDNLVTKYIKIK